MPRSRKRSGKDGVKKQYRFTVNDAVLCRAGDCWIAGKIYKLVDDCAEGIKYVVDTGHGHSLCTKCDLKCCMKDTHAFLFCDQYDVLCLTEDEVWRAGKIIGHDFVGADGQTWAYVVKLHQGHTVYAPSDCDECIRQRFRYTFTSVYDDDDEQKWLRVRFDIGTHVVCREDVFSDTWARGNIIEHDFEDSKGVKHPYHVRLQSGKLVHIAVDNDSFIKLAVKYYFSPEHVPDGPEHAVRVRFWIGTRVLIRTVDSDVKWEKAVVLGYNWQEPIVPGVFYPYQVKLDNGDLFYTPTDDDEQIKRDY